MNSIEQIEFTYRFHLPLLLPLSLTATYYSYRFHLPLLLPLSLTATYYSYRFHLPLPITATAFTYRREGAEPLLTKMHL